MVEIKRFVHKIAKIGCLITCWQLPFLSAQAQPTQPKITFTVSMEDPGDHLFHVQLLYKHPAKTVVDFNMCAWTPGFYEIVDFAGAVEHFQASNIAGGKLAWTKTSDKSWRINDPNGDDIKLDYDVKAVNPFIGNINLDSNYAYIIPGALLIYPTDQLDAACTIEIQPYRQWRQYVATSLDSIPGRSNVFFAPNFDVLYDSPFLMGDLEALPAFSVSGKPVQFVGYRLGEFDKIRLMADLKKIVESANAIIRDIPYTHYTFLAVGLKGGGFGGIEHLNSVSMLINTYHLLEPDRKNSFYSFLAHEYFHLYNVKRIRPIELGPFDYSRENYTDLLWVSEGFTDYYEFLILNRAGLMSAEEVLENYQEHIRNYENKPGHLYQSAVQASRGIWAIGGNPNARTAEDLTKTISIYDKGCALGMLLDLAIRHHTENKRSLDDVMRVLYKTYYQKKHSGFTSKAFQSACESVAGTSLAEIFSYATTVKPVNYPKYLRYAGLAIDTMTRTLAGAYIGADIRSRDGLLLVKEVDYASPAWNAGLQAGDQILAIDSANADIDKYDAVMSEKKKGDTLELRFQRKEKVVNIRVPVTEKREKSFAITPLQHPDSLQKKIYRSWLRGFN